MTIDIRRIADPQDLLRWKQMATNKTKNIAEETISKRFQNITQSVAEYNTRMLKYSPNSTLRFKISEKNIPNAILSNAAK